MPASHHLIVGGQRSGKSAHAERLGRQWLATPGHRVSVVATAQAWDEEMRQRIRHHQARRPPGFATLEEPRQLSRLLAAQAAPGHLLIVDCLTLWLTNWLMPIQGTADTAAWATELEALDALLPELPSPVVFISNEVGWGVIPLGREVRHYVDELGRLNQRMASRCAHLTLMVAGQPWTRPVEALT